MDKLSKIEPKTLKQILSDLFAHKDKDIFSDKLFIREISEIISETLTEELTEEERKKGEFLSIKNYNEHFDDFRSAMQKITMASYYKMTKIELSCTSVDLDNRVLRFFNQKTTPRLTVCRAVQMTGSFPVGFQAQTWKQEWGHYLIHYEDTRR